MKTKTIQSVISKKMEEWFKSIRDSELQELVRQNTFVTGGCITSMLLREKVNDYDVYFRTREVTKRVAEYYVKRFEIKNKAGVDFTIKVWDRDADRIKIVIKSAGIASEEGTTKPYEYFELSEDPNAATEYVEDVMGKRDEEEEKKDTGADYRPVFMSSNAISLSKKVQLVLRFYGEPEEIHANYDFVHCTNYWTSWDKKLVTNAPALESILTKELKYVGSKYPVCSIFRLRKFLGRGWTVNAGQILKMIWQIHELPLGNVEVLEDQLTGVDAAYFSELIRKLREEDTDKVNATYLAQIINELF